MRIWERNEGALRCVSSLEGVHAGSILSIKAGDRWLAVGAADNSMSLFHRPENKPGSCVSPWQLLRTPPRSAAMVRKLPTLVCPKIVVEFFSDLSTPVRPDSCSGSSSKVQQREVTKSISMLFCSSAAHSYLFPFFVNAIISTLSCPGMFDHSPFVLLRLALICSLFLHPYHVLFLRSFEVLREVV